MAPSTDGTLQALPIHIPASFSLRSGSFMNERDRALFNAIFPGNAGYISQDLFLYVLTETPPNPRPKSFSGLPVIFVRQDEMQGVPACFPPATKPISFMVDIHQAKIATHLYYKKGPFRDTLELACEPLFRAVREHFALIDVPITEFSYWTSHLLIVLGSSCDQDTRRKLPSFAGHLFCQYISEADMNRPANFQSRAQQAAEDLRRYDASMHVGEMRTANQYDFVTLVPPGTGSVHHGQILGVATQKVHNVDGGPSDKWMTVNYTYVGSDTTQELSRADTGTAIRGQDGKILSVLQYAITQKPWVGWCVGTSTEELMGKASS